MNESIINTLKYLMLFGNNDVQQLWLILKATRTTPSKPCVVMVNIYLPHQHEPPI